jgi:hypothetical protein
VVAVGVASEREGTDDGVELATVVAVERKSANGGIVAPGHAQIASIVAKKGVASTEVVQEELAAFQDVPGGG